MTKTLHRDSWDQYVALVEKKMAFQAAEIERMLAVLLKAREKLAAYYTSTGGDYPGGPLYRELMAEINAALVHQQTTTTETK